MTPYILGQFFGIVVTILCLIGSFWKKKWQMNMNVFAANLCGILNLVLIGKGFSTAIIMNGVACVQSVIGTIHLFTGKKVTTAERIIFIVLYAVLGFAGLVTSEQFVPAVNLHNLVELMPIFGAVLLGISVFIRDEQTSRKFALANACIYLVYFITLGSTQIFAQIGSIVMTSIALYTYRNSPKSVE